MRKALLVVTAAAAGAYLITRAQEIAEREERPLVDVLMDIPGRILDDLSTLGDDIRAAADEGSAAAERWMDDLDDDLADA